MELKEKKAPSTEDFPVLIAAIAAIKAYEEDGSAGNLFVRKIKRFPGGSTAWIDTGRADAMFNRKF